MKNITILPICITILLIWKTWLIRKQQEKLGVPPLPPAAPRSLGEGAQLSIFPAALRQASISVRLFQASPADFTRGPATHKVRSRRGRCRVRCPCLHFCCFASQFFIRGRPAGENHDIVTAGTDLPLTFFTFPKCHPKFVASPHSWASSRPFLGPQMKTEPLGLPAVPWHAEVAGRRAYTGAWPPGLPQLWGRSGREGEARGPQRGVDPSAGPALGAELPPAPVLGWHRDGLAQGFLQCRRTRLNPWLGKVCWRKKWLPTPVFLPGEFHGHRSLASYSPWGQKSRTGLSL